MNLPQSLTIKEQFTLSNYKQKMDYYSYLSDIHFSKARTYFSISKFLGRIASIFQPYSKTITLAIIDIAVHYVDLSTTQNNIAQHYNNTVRAIHSEWTEWLDQMALKYFT